MDQDEFLWGAATSSYQVEGSIENNDWYYFERTGAVDGGVNCGRSCDHLTHFKEDLKLAADMGLNSYRFSIEWARIEPTQGEWDDAALQWYSDLISECEALKLKPMLTLLHFTIPKWFADLGGFTSDQAPQFFSRYVEKVIERFGERIPLWCTVNEPLVLAIGSYLGKFMPPAVFSPRKVATAIANLLESHCRAYDLIHQQISKRSGPWKDDELKVGYAHNVLAFKPNRKSHFIERIIAAKAEAFYNDAWINATFGRKQNFKFPFFVGRVRAVKEAIDRVTCDFIGLNYYTNAYIQWWPHPSELSSGQKRPLAMSFAKKTDEVSDLEWAINPDGLKKLILKYAKLGRPIIITENGIADQSDSKRPKYLIQHLKVIAELIEQGVDIQGYYHWSLLDNFEWIKGFWPRFGLISVDYNTFQRKLTASGRLYSQIIASNHKQKPRRDRIPVSGPV